jgi:hypothetical protein
MGDVEPLVPVDPVPVRSTKPTFGETLEFGAVADAVLEPDPSEPHAARPIARRLQTTTLRICERAARRMFIEATPVAITTNTRADTPDTRDI